MFKSRWLIFVPVLFLALFMPSKVHATQIGLLVRGYQVSEIPPTKSDLAYPLCGSSIEPFINASWDWQPYEQCKFDFFMLHYQGFIQIPPHDTIEFFVASDDGGTVKIGTDEFGVWQDQGCSATFTGQLQLEAGTQVLDAWMYENGGGTCFMLAWNIDDTGWQIVQPEYFTSEPIQTTTTTGQPQPTDPPTTILESTTSSVLPSTTEGQQIATTLPQTSSSSPTSSTSTTTTEPPVQSTLLEILIPTQTTYEQTTTTVEVTTTTVADISQTTVELSPVVTDAIVETTTTVLEEPTTTTVLPVVEVAQPLSEEQFVEVLSVLDNATPEEVKAIIDEVLQADLSTDQAVQLVASPEVLTAISGEQAQQLFESIEPTELSNAMAAVIADTLNDPDVPTEVKQAFEEAINIFDNDGFSNYVPLGSAVSVAVRRVVIAGITAVSVASAGSAIRRRI